MEDLTLKRLKKIIDKAEHRYDWYCKEYPWKARTAESAKRWWEALVSGIGAVNKSCHGEITPRDVYRVLPDMVDKIHYEPYLDKADKRWGVLK
jgi:hypothetical protein